MLEIVPALADQLTSVFEVPVILALNCCVPFETTVVLLGETVMPGRCWVVELSAATTMRADPVPRSNPVESVTVKRKEYSPATAGTPIIEPV